MCEAVGNLPDQISVEGGLIHSSQGNFRSQQLVFAEVLPRPGIERARKLQEMISFGAKGVHDYGGSCGIPQLRNVLFSDYYYASVDPGNGDIYARFYQYQEGLDERFGIINGRGWKEEVSSILEVRVGKQGEEGRRRKWRLDFRLLNGPELEAALEAYRCITRDEFSFSDNATEEFRESQRTANNRLKERIADTKSKIEREIALYS